MSLSYGYVAYIDEAGDDGIGKFKGPGEGGQSHWLVLTACLIRTENELNVVRWRDEISAAFPKRRRREVHFQDLNHEQRVVAASVLSKQPVGLVSVLSNKMTIGSSPTFAKACISEKNVLYKYLLRHLLERVTDSVKRAREIDRTTVPMLKIIFSRRGGMDYRDFQTYLDYLKDLQTQRGSYYPIHWPCIDASLIVAEDHSRVAGLQLADVAASSFFHAVEPNAYGFTEPRYAGLLKPCVLKAKGARERLDYGVKPVPNLGKMTLSVDQKAFFSSWAKGDGG